MMCTLAASDGVAIWLAVATLIMQIALTGFVMWREQRSRQVALRLEKIESLEDRVAADTERRMDAKVDAAFTRLSDRLDALAAELKRVLDRLQRGDGHFEQLRERDAKQIERVLTELSSMKDWMNERFATQDQIRELRGEVSELRKKVHP